jgi:hypothetical protein
MSFKALDPEDLVISSDAITATVWSNYAPTLNSFYTSSTQVASNTANYYYDIYNLNPTGSTAERQFSLAYCDINGSGSTFYNFLVTGSSPSRTLYGQYKSLVLGNEYSNFIFGNYSASYFYAMPINRARYKETLFPGSLTLTLSGSAGTINLTDDSQVTPSITFLDSGRVFNLVSGSAGNVYTGTNALGWAGGATAASGSYGWLLPDIGVILLNGVALDGGSAAGGISLGTSRAANTTSSYNLTKIYTAVSGGASFTINSQETLTSDYVFVRARNSEFNYSENPSFISGSTGAVLYSLFINSPQTYITTVGLYNDNNDLLAVAKLSAPLVKDFTKELLIRCKLSF